MALSTQVGTVTQPATPTTTTTSLPAGFDPKFLLVTCVARTANGGGSAHAVWSMGMATYRGATAQQRYISFGSEDNIGTADVYVGAGSADVIKIQDGTTGAVDLEVAFVSFGSGGSSNFVLDWQNLHTTASVTLYYTVVGGSDVEDALVSQYTSAAVGAQDVTVAAGFGQPDIVFWPISWNGTDPPAAGNGDTQFGFGVKSGSANGRMIRFGSQDNATTQATNQATHNNRAVAVGNNGAIEWAQQLNPVAGWPTDGFEVNNVTALAGFPVPYGAVRFSSNVVVTAGENSSPTGAPPVAQTLTCSGTPRLALIINTRNTAVNTVDTTSTDAAMWGIGMIDGAGNERYMGASDDDGQATTSVAATFQTDAKAIQTWNPGANVMDAEADVAVSGSDYVATWNDTHTSAFFYEWVTFGETGAAPELVPALSMAPYQGAY